MGLKFVLKVFGRGYGGDSPQCGEMSEGQRGPPLLAEPFLRKVSPDKYIDTSVQTSPLSGEFSLIMERIGILVIG